MPGRTGWTDEGHDTDVTRFLRARGKIRALMLFVDFPDAQATGTVNEYLAHLAPSAEWLRRTSYDRVRLSISPLRRWLRMPRDSTTYGFQRGITFEEHEAYLRQAVAAAEPYADFSQYDLVYVVPTKTASAITFSPTYIHDPSTAGVVADGKRVKWGVTYGQDIWRWGHKVVAHETSHTFGLPDLYAFTGTGGHRFVGGWDVMGDIAGAAPEHVAWERWKLGWVDDRQVVCLPRPGDRRVRLNAVERPGGTKLAVVRTGETTAYVAESRKAFGGDAKACSTGVLIYKVDSAAPTGEGPVRVMNGNPAATPPAGCGPLDMAAHRPGQAFTDPTTGVRVQVVRSGPGSDDVVIAKR